ncbi:MAG: hypothetical protein IID31_07965 [Planctomycetes bacterium]|nr:hypothetical protein [Planctomycetota bacterium]
MKLGKRRGDLRLIVELFALANLAFLALDIYLAHSMNAFRHAAEWIPFVFSLAASVALLVGLVAQRPRVGHRIGLVVGWAAVLVGVAGMIFHLDSHFFEARTIKSLVYTAPFVAPLAYTGIGLLLILNRTTDASSEDWARWVLVLALGGFVGNFGLSLADHAQNGFFDWREWLAVIFAAIGIGFLVTATFLQPSLRFIQWCAGVMLAEIVIAIIGFVLHARANLHGPSASMFDNFVFGAPVFAPLLFANLALLALIGLWALSRMVSACSGMERSADHQGRAGRTRTSSLP